MVDVFDRCREWSAYRAQVPDDHYPYFRCVDGVGGAEVEVDGRRVIMAGSNDYLGLSGDPRVRDAAARALATYGPTCSGSRLLNGTTALHVELEHRLAAFLGRPAALVLTTGFQANLAVATLVGRDCEVFADRDNHASLVDATRLGFGRIRRYRHNDMHDLRRLLEAADPNSGKLVVSDGMFSMGGDLCDLPSIVRLAGAHRARVAVDSAHDLGLLGERGRGVAEYFGVEDQVDLVTGTLSKCFGSLGGVVAGPTEVVDYLRHQARSFLFSAALPAANVAAALAALDIIENEPQRRDHAIKLAERLHNGLRAVGFDTGDSVTTVVPVTVSDPTTCLRLCSQLLAAGVFVNAVLPPASPAGTCMVRTTMTAAHTDTQVDRVVDAFTTVGRRLELIPPSPPVSFEPVRMASVPVGSEATSRRAGH